MNLATVLYTYCTLIPETLVGSLYHNLRLAGAQYMSTDYGAVSGVLRTIDPPPPLPLASVSSPRTEGGGYKLAGW